MCTWNDVLAGNWQDLQRPDSTAWLFVALFCTLFHFTFTLFRDVTPTQNVDCLYLVLSVFLYWCKGIPDVFIIINFCTSFVFCITLLFGKHSFTCIAVVVKHFKWKNM